LLTDLPLGKVALGQPLLLRLRSAELKVQGKLALALALLRLLFP